MKSYIYTGPLSGVSLTGHGDVMLIPGSTVQLPEGNGYTERLIRKGWLHEVVESVAEGQVDEIFEKKSKGRK